MTPQTTSDLEREARELTANMGDSSAARFREGYYLEAYRGLLFQYGLLAARLKRMEEQASA